MATAREKFEAWKSEPLPLSDFSKRFGENSYWECWKAALASQPPSQPVDAWQDISTAPFGESGKEETYFIGGVQDGSRINTATCYRNKHGAYEWWGGGISPKYWMPLNHLPSAPIQKTADKEKPL